MEFKGDRWEKGPSPGTRPLTIDNTNPIGGGESQEKIEDWANAQIVNPEGQAIETATGNEFHEKLNKAEVIKFIAYTRGKQPNIALFPMSISAEMKNHDECWSMLKFTTRPRTPHRLKELPQPFVELVLIGAGRWEDGDAISGSKTLQDIWPSDVAAGEKILSRVRGFLAGNENIEEWGESRFLNEKGLPLDDSSRESFIEMVKEYESTRFIAFTSRGEYLIYLAPGERSRDLRHDQRWGMDIMPNFSDAKFAGAGYFEGVNATFESDTMKNKFGFDRPKSAEVQSKIIEQIEGYLK